MNYYTAKFERERKNRPCDWAINQFNQLVPLTDAAREDQRRDAEKLKYVGSRDLGYQY